MKKQVIENKILQVIDAVKKGDLVEDQFVELKSQFGDNFPKLARRLAALANASGGEPVLWIVGLDEKAGVIGADLAELANWWPQIESEFRSASPLMEISCCVNHEDGNVVGLVFLTADAPYLVRNPEQGTIIAEVPWREGNRTRTAERVDLLRILVPRAKEPVLEPVHAVVDYLANAQGRRLKVILHQYVYPRNKVDLVIPYHKAELIVTPLVDGLPITLPVFTDTTRALNIAKDQLGSLVQHNRSEILVTGPGAMILEGESRFGIDGVPGMANQQISVSARLFAYGLEQPLISKIVLPSVTLNNGHQIQWREGRAF